MLSLRFSSFLIVWCHRGQPDAAYDIAARIKEEEEQQIQKMLRRQKREVEMIMENEMRMAKAQEQEEERRQLLKEQQRRREEAARERAIKLAEKRVRQTDPVAILLSVLSLTSLRLCSKSGWKCVQL